MRHIATAFSALTLSLSTIAQDTIPDFHGDEGNPALALWDASDWLMDLNHDPVPDIMYVTDGITPSAFLAKASKISFVLALMDTAGVAPDTLYQFDMVPNGELAEEVDPERVGDPQEAYRNIYRPETMPGGTEEIQGYDKIAYYGIYPDIDMTMYTASSGYRMSFICYPGSDPDNVQMRFSGADSLSIDFYGYLVLWREGHFVRFDKAVAYQVDANNDVVPVTWSPTWVEVDDDDVIGFTVDSYDPALPLILQVGPPPRAALQGSGTPPCWGTYFGSVNQELIVASGTDSDGNYYILGMTQNAYFDFPNASGGGGSQNGNGVGGPQKFFLTKFNADHVIQWSSFICTLSSSPASPQALAVKDSPDRSIYIAGSTNNVGMYYEGLPGAYLDSVGTQSIPNACISKFDEDGFCTWSTYFSDIETHVTGMAVDSQDRLWISGRTKGGLPTPSGGQPGGATIYTYGGGIEDGFWAVFDEDDALWLSSYTGGEDDYEELRSLAARFGKVVAVGYTSSDSLPTVDGGSLAWDQASLGNDLWLMEWNEAGVVQHATYVGGTGIEVTSGLHHCIAIDNDSDVVIIAQTSSSDLPLLLSGLWNNFTPTNAMIAEFDGTTRARKWLTYLGTTWDGFLPLCLAYDALGNLYVGGNARATGFMLQEINNVYYDDTPGATCIGSPNSGNDAGLLIFSPQKWLSYGSYFGGQELVAPYILEGFHTLAWHNDVLYASGATVGHLPDPDCKPTLFDPGAGAYYQDTVYTYLAPLSTGFIIGLCTEEVTSTGDALAPTETFQVQATPEGMVIQSSTDQRVQVRLHDTAGRLVFEEGTRITSGSSPVLALPHMAEGVYLVRCAGEEGVYSTKIFRFR
jgi:hypothetical protein